MPAQLLSLDFCSINEDLSWLGGLLATQLTTGPGSWGTSWLVPTCPIPVGQNHPRILLAAPTADPSLKSRLQHPGFQPGSHMSRPKGAARPQLSQEPPPKCTSSSRHRHPHLGASRGRGQWGGFRGGLTEGQALLALLGGGVGAGGRGATLRGHVAGAGGLAAGGAAGEQPPAAVGADGAVRQDVLLLDVGGLVNPLPDVSPGDEIRTCPVSAHPVSPRPPRCPPPRPWPHLLRSDTSVPPAESSREASPDPGVLRGGRWLSPGLGISSWEGKAEPRRAPSWPWWGERAAPSAPWRGEKPVAPGRCRRPRASAVPVVPAGAGCGSGRCCRGCSS